VRLGVFTVLYSELSFGEALERLASLGVEAVEVGTGNFPGDAHCKPADMLRDERARSAFMGAVESHGMFVSALSQHGNPLHPDEAVSAAAHATWRDTVRLAGLLQIPVVNAFSGCPGDSPSARWPNWVTCAWPSDFRELLEWQWTERVIPYWQREAEFAREHGVRIAFEMHPGFVVYNPETLLRLREACGEAVGANYDPSHLVWQGMDPVQTIRDLAAADALFHVHAKDTWLDPPNIARNGVLDTKDYTRVLERSWTFRTVGYGRGEEMWRDIMSALRTVGYDYVMSIEHEDALLSIDEGLTKAVSLLNRLMFREKPGEMWWA
jgi:sugar phosphate isomerase/epimerase